MENGDISVVVLTWVSQGLWAMNDFV